jgi:aldose 1-epimerase
LSLEHAADDAAGRSAWPWPFTATQRFHLTAGQDRAALVATLTLRSRASEPFPFGLGWHPYFPKLPDTTLGFDADGVWRNDAGLLPVQRDAIPAEWCFEPARVLSGAVLDNVFTGWRGTARLTQPSLGMRVTVEADRACAYLVVYAPPGAAYVAIEPVTQQTDAFNRAAAGAADTGTRTLAPGASFSCTMRVSVEALASTR